MKTCLLNSLFVAISMLVGVGCATSNPKPRVFVAEEESSDTESKGRWVADKGDVNKTTPSTTPLTVATNFVASVEKPGFPEQPSYRPEPLPETLQKRGFWRGFFGTPSTPMLTDGIRQSSLPANPVRRSYRSFTLPTMWGTYNYNHSQGTDNSASRYWDDNGPHEEVRQSTYINTSESFQPERRRWVAPTYYQQYQGNQGTITWP